ncbi:MAG: T9SS type A sorting domain-containing protein [Bacteroidetes bacterium]|nr:T9SS type A sorting domain-containing protein [Bacteroidota bacterium]
MGHVIDYDDESICQQAGYFRNSQAPITADMPLGFKLVPNPAIDRVEVILNGKIDGNFSLLINDMTGRSVFQSNFANKDVSFHIPTHFLSPGIYQVRIAYNNNYTEIQKLSIVR